MLEVKNRLDMTDLESECQGLSLATQIRRTSFRWLNLTTDLLHTASIATRLNPPNYHGCGLRRWKLSYAGAGQLILSLG